MIIVYKYSFSFDYIAPDDPPQNLTSTNNINSISFGWLPPSVPNGIICRYVFSIATSDIITTYFLDADQNTITLDNFDPYQFYSVNVIASTFVNGNFADSPPATLMEFTLPGSKLLFHTMSIVLKLRTTYI